MNDDIHKLQKALVQQLRASGSLTTDIVEQAFLSVPRHLFLPETPVEEAYSDQAIVVRQGAGGEWTSASSQPAIMAIMLEQLDLKPGQRVLEIGTGSGFNAALIASIVGPGRGHAAPTSAAPPNGNTSGMAAGQAQRGTVVTVDIQPDLIEHARRCLDEAGYGWVQTRVGDGGHGDPDGAPFDRIILTAASDVIAPAWIEQLAEGGRLALPLAVVSGAQHCVAFEKRGQALVSVSICSCGFMALQGMFAPLQPARTQVGPDPRLCLFTENGKALPADADTIAAWLTAAGGDRATGITVTMPELWRSLFSWMGLQNARRQEAPGLGGSLWAMGDLADEPGLPALFGMGGERKSMIAGVWLEPDGMAALIRAPGQRPPLADASRPEDTAPFELYVRPFGPGAGAAERMLAQVQAWDQAGRPASSRLQIRASPAEADDRVAEDEFLIERPWTNLIVRYQE